MDSGAGYTYEELDGERFALLAKTYPAEAAAIAAMPVIEDLRAISRLELAIELPDVEVQKIIACIARLRVDLRRLERHLGDEAIHTLLCRANDNRVVSFCGCSAMHHVGACVAIGWRVHNLLAVTAGHDLWRLSKSTDLDGAAVLARRGAIVEAKLLPVSDAELIDLENQIEAELYRAENLTRADKPDSKPDNEKESVRIPGNPDVLRLAKFIRDNRHTGDSESRLAKQFTDGDAKKANNLLRQLRRFPDLKK